MGASRDRPSRAELVRAMLAAGRQMSTGAIMLHQAVADRLGLHPTDHKCADLLCMNGPLTAGELAERTGLTTGAITGVIDRLESAGYVRREADPADRRRVVVQVIPKSLRQVGRLFEPLAAGMAELCARYTDRELATILDFMNRSREVAHREMLRLRGKAGPGAKGARKRPRVGSGRP
ncbi:MAG: MarR family transcriptional regulator [Zavarzinella sp.]|nr:MarR family transcriptional regulator [Zavarzinella sp.]